MTPNGADWRAIHIAGDRNRRGPEARIWAPQRAPARRSGRPTWPYVVLASGLAAVCAAIILRS